MTTGEMRLRSVTFKDTARIADSLTNALTGMGTMKDPRLANAYARRLLSFHEISAAYSGSGLMRKIINIPALDMVREWRNWNAEVDHVTALEKAERKLMLRQKVRHAEIMRGLGGGALVLGLPGIPSQPAPKLIAADQLAYIHVLNRWQLTFSEMQDDATLDNYDEPVMWKMQTATGQVDIHPTRVITFRGDPAPPMTMMGDQERYWGESRVQQVLDAVEDCDGARQAFSALVQKARNVRIGIPDLLNVVSSPDGEAAFQRRMAAFATAESIFNATVFDNGRDGKAGEVVTDAIYNFAGAKDMMQSFAMFASAVSDIPQTRLFGTAPDGMNASGDSQQRDWNKMVGAKQSLELAPCLDKLDAFLIPSALGSTPPELWYEFAELDQETESEQATRFDKLMDAVTKLQNTGTIPDIALAKGVQSLMSEEAFLPGLDAALAEMPDDERFGVVPDMTAPDMALGGGDPNLADPNAAPALARKAANDAAPRTLYVSRPVLNVDELQAWATSQGLGELQPDLHVTIVYSRTLIDWMKIDGDSWGQGSDGMLDVPPGGVRIVEPLGNRTAVLLFTSSQLAWRHQSILSAGATSDYPDYQPHVSLTGEPVDLSNVEPYQGIIKLGPERFEEVDPTK